MIVRIILSLALLFSLTAKANEVYVIKNIKISASNKNASAARNQAIEGGQLKAFRGLVKLHYPEAQNKIDTIDKEDIYSLVEGYELSEEKRSATNYYAKLKVKFSRSHVDKLMQSLGAKFSGSLEKNHQEVLELEKPAAVDQVVSEVKDAPNLTTLVVPIFIHNGRDYWFDDDNPWLNIWQKHKLGNKFVLPMVDLEDLTIINKNILNKNLIDLSSLFEKYGVNNIALYTVEDIENGSNHNLTLKVNYINKYHYSWQAYHFADIIGADINQLLEKAYSETQNFKFNSNLDACCKIANDLNTLPPQKLMVDFPIDKISDWLQLQHILKGISYVSEVNLEKVTAKNYYFSCMSSISVEDLKGLLLKYNLKLEEQGDGFVLTKVEAVEEFRNTASGENANNGFDLD